MVPIPSFGAENRYALELLLALCVRRGELLGARWDEFDLCGSTPVGAVWHLPASRTKTGAPLDIPLVSTAVSWLRELKALDAGTDYLFPRRRRDRRERVPHVGLDTLNAALQRVQHRLPPCTLHDLRRTARTQLSALGVRREVAERCLAHAIRGVEGTYDRHDYFRERRAALEQWPDMTHAIALSPEHISRDILVLRGHRVLLDSQLAALYGVTTKRLNEQVKRNVERFPDDFMLD